MLDAGKRNANSPQRRRGRSWLRFGLRTLLIAFAVISIVLGLVSRELVRLRQQRGLVAQVEAGGGGVAYAHQFDSAADAPLAGWISKLLRRAFGNDIFSDVVSVKWEYTYKSVAGGEIERLRQFPTLRQVAFFGSPRATGRPPTPGEDPPEDLDAAAEIEAQAAAFGTITDCQNVTHLTLYGGLPTDAHLKRLGAGGHLRRLELSNARFVSDEGIEAISRFENLEWLDICEVPGATDRGLVTLSRLTNLRSLDLSGTPISDLALAELSRLVQLERLLLDKNSVTDAGVSTLSKLTKLKLLRVSRSQITDEGLKAIGALRALESLDLSGTQITNAGLDHLMSLGNLVRLNLAQTQVTDAGLPRLAALANLRRVVVLLGHELTLDGIRRTKQDMPDCLFECLYTTAQGKPPSLYAWE